MNNQEIMKQVDDEIEKIEKAVEHLENGGHIKCSIPECGDFSCSSAVVYNAISVARIQTNLIIAQSLAQKDKEREEVVRDYRTHLLGLVGNYLAKYPNAKLDEFRWLVVGDEAGKKSTLS